MLQHFRIVGSARLLPSHPILSSDLDRRYGLSTGTTLARTGVRVRYQAREQETGATMAREVIQKALQNAELSLREIDLIIDASLCLQQPIPCNAALLQETLGEAARGIPCLDVHASCLGFVAAVNVVNGLCASGAAKRVLVVCAETPLQGVNWNEPDSACLMGDAAAAFVFEAVPEAKKACTFAIETFAEGARFCEVQGGGHRLSPFEYSPSQHHRYTFHMDGKALHKLASRLLPPLVERALAECRCTLDELQIIPHQASGLALESIARRLEAPRGRFHTTIAEHGNLVAASIPYVLHGVRQQHPPGTRTMLLGTAAGYTQAVAIFEL